MPKELFLDFLLGLAGHILNLSLYTRERER